MLLSLDIETTGLNPNAHDAKVVCIACVTEHDKTYFAVVPPYLGQQEKYWHAKPWVDYYTRKVPKQLNTILNLIADPNNTVVMHRATFDNIYMKLVMGVPFLAKVECTKTMAQLLGYSPQESGLKYLARNILKDTVKEEADLIRYRRRKRWKSILGRDFNYGDFPIKLLKPYCIWDAKCALLLYMLFNKQVKKHARFIYSIEMKCLKPITHMEKYGLPMDVPLLLRYEKETRKYLVFLVAQLKEQAWSDFNPNSHQQKAKLLYHHIRNKAGRKYKCDRFTAKGQNSTDKKSLLAINHPVAELLLEYQHWYKIHGTYLKSMKKRSELVGEELHCIIDPLGAGTGRFSMKDMNLNNLPERDKTVKECCIADKQGRIIHYDT